MKMPTPIAIRLFKLILSIAAITMHELILKVCLETEG